MLSGKHGVATAFHCNVPSIVANCVATVLAMIASSMCVLKGHGGGSFQFACSARTHLLSQAVKR